MTTRASDLFDFLESIAPLHLQEEYDNSGLLIGDKHQVVKGVMIALDCTEEIMEEALQAGCNVVITHHPAIFYGVKHFTGSNLTERIIIKAIRNDLVIYAIHTNLDNILTNGVNERIAQRLDLKKVNILKPIDPEGNKNEGAGVVGNLPEALSELQFLNLLKDRMQAKVIRHSKFLNKPIEKVAICGGSGSFLLEEAIRKEADAFVTADYKYHGFFDADARIIICDIGHYESEQYTISLLQELISGKFHTFAAHYTRINTNPVHYFT